MMKKYDLKKVILITFLLLALILLAVIPIQNMINQPKSNDLETEQASNEGQNNDYKNNYETEEDNNIVDNTSDNAEEPETNEPENNNDEIDTIENKYYVNSNYYIKPQDPNVSDKVVLLTFDDTPQGDFTLEILDILDKYDAKAIFFVNGHYAVKHQDLVMEIYNRGHILGNHTWWHENLKKITPEKTTEEIVKVNDLIEEWTGERPKYFRPPFGVMSDYAKEVVADENMQSMNWSLGSLDWEYNKAEQSDEVVEQVLNNIVPGANILMHDKEVTAIALEQILEELTNQGYSFVLPTEVIID